MTNPVLHGVIPAVPTPIDGYGAPDCTRLVAVIKNLLEAGCHGINLLGTTGEATSFDRETRIKIMEAVARHETLMPYMMVGTGAASLEDTIALTAVADSLGYQGALLLPPFYYKDIGEEALQRCIEEVADKVAPRSLRFYLYNIPQLTGIAYTEKTVRALSERLGSLLAGLKDSSGNLEYAKAMADNFASLAVFPSNEATLSTCTEMGFAGCISASVNVAPHLACEVFQGAQIDKGKHSYDTMVAVRTALSSFPLVPAVKAAVAAQRCDPAWSRMKAPLTPLDGDQQKRLLGLLNSLGVMTPN